MKMINNIRELRKVIGMSSIKELEELKEEEKRVEAEISELEREMRRVDKEV